MSNNNKTTIPKLLVFGSDGWIAENLRPLIANKDIVICDEQFWTKERMENRQSVQDLLETIKPTHVFNCAGRTGRPNVDWCEDNKVDTLRSNVLGTLNLADCCFQAGIHCTVFSTGCLYEYDDTHPFNGPGFTEVDEPNFFGSFYSKTKGTTEALLKNYPNCLILRLRMPVSDDLHPRSFVTKITNYERVVDIPNSNTVLHDLLPLAITMAAHGDTGVYNFTNPGAISHNEVLSLFRNIVRPSLTWQNFSREQEATILKAERSNCKLDTTKLEGKAREYGIMVPHIVDSYTACFRRMQRAGVA